MKIILKYLIVLTLLLSCATNSLERKPANDIDSSLENVLPKMADALISIQHSEGHWEGYLEGDPSLDAIFLVLAKKLNKLDQNLLNESLDRIFKWRGNDPFWKTSTDGVASLDITFMILHSLKKIGIDSQDDRVKDSWDWLLEKLKTEKINLITKMLLVPMEVLPLSMMPPVSPLLFANPNFMPFSVKSLGIGRLYFIPFTVWRYYKKAAIDHRSVSPFIRNSSPQKPYYIGHPLKAKMKTFDEDFWAQEGFEWILSHADSQGGWYNSQETMINLMAMITAQELGVYNFEGPIEQGWKKLMASRVKDRNGPRYLQMMNSAIWDTAYSLAALLAIPKDLQPPLNQAASNKALDFLLDHQIKTKGDWSWALPNVAPGGWSFSLLDKEYPDTDDSELTLKALLLSDRVNEPKIQEAIIKGLNWVMSMQNNDGGFPSFEKDVSKVTEYIFQQIFPHQLDMSDLSQTDVSSRVLELMAHAKEIPFLKNNFKNLQTTMDKTCQYMLRNTEKGSPRIWEGRWLANYLYGTAGNINGLLQANCLTLSEAHESLDWIISKQHADGGFGESTESYRAHQFVDGPSSAIQTGFVLNALLTYEAMYVKKLNKHSSFYPQINKGIEFLKNQIGSDYFIQEKYYLGTYIKGIQYMDYGLFPQYLTIQIFSRYLNLLKN